MSQLGTEEKIKKQFTLTYSSRVGKISHALGRTKFHFCVLTKKMRRGL